MPSHFKSTSTQDQAIQSWRRLPMSVLTGKLNCKKTIQYKRGILTKIVLLVPSLQRKANMSLILRAIRFLLTLPLVPTPWTLSNSFNSVALKSPLQKLLASTLSTNFKKKIRTSFFFSCNKIK
jgi:hypothetical protein